MRKRANDTPLRRTLSLAPAWQSALATLRRALRLFRAEGEALGSLPSIVSIG